MLPLPRALDQPQCQVASKSVQPLAAVTSVANQPWREWGKHRSVDMVMEVVRTFVDGVQIYLIPFISVWKVLVFHCWLLWNNRLYHTLVPSTACTVILGWIFFWMKLLPGHRSNAHLIEANLSNPFNFQSLQGFQLQGALPPDPLCVVVGSKQAKCRGHRERRLQFLERLVINIYTFIHFSGKSLKLLTPNFIFYG